MKRKEHYQYTVKGTKLSNRDDSKSEFTWTFRVLLIILISTYLSGIAAHLIGVNVLLFHLTTFIFLLFTPVLIYSSSEAGKKSIKFLGQYIRFTEKSKGGYIVSLLLNVTIIMVLLNVATGLWVLLDIMKAFSMYMHEMTLLVYPPIIIIYVLYKMIMYRSKS